MQFDFIMHSFLKHSDYEFFMLFVCFRSIIDYIELFSEQKLGDLSNCLCCALALSIHGLNTWYANSFGIFTTTTTITT